MKRNALYGRVGRGSSAALVALVFLAALVAGCETSSTVSTSGPSSVKCQVSLAAPSMMDAGGGTGSVAITTQPECAWDASTNVGWISGISPTSGQGTADVSFRVAANEGSTSRDGTIVVNGEQARVSQRAPCRYEVAPSTQTIGADGGPGRLTIATANECAWTVTAEVGWITLTSPAAGSGPVTVTFTIAPNEGAARSGSIAVANQRPAITQTGVSVPQPPAPPTPPPACNAVISPTSQDIGAAGGAGASVTVSAASTCQWTTTSNATWITVTSGASGAGNGSVTFSVAANTGAARTGTLAIAARTFTVTQAASSSPTPPPPAPPPPPPSCSYSLSATSASVPAAGDAASVNVSTVSGCAWTAGSNASWIAITSGASGSGNGSVGFLVAPNVGGSRTGTLTIAGQTFTVSQAALVCVYAISPANQRVGRGGGTATISVSTTSGCTWTAASNTSWISITSGASGAGNGSVTFSYERNNGGNDRVGSLTVAGRAATVEQNGGGNDE